MLLSTTILLRSGFIADTYHILQTIVPPECTHSESGGTILHKKIKLLKVRFPIPSKMY